MGISDIFKIKKFKNKIETLEKEIIDLEKILTPEMQQIFDYDLEICKLQERKNSIENQITKKNLEISALDKTIKFKKENVIILDDTCKPRTLLQDPDNYF